MCCGTPPRWNCCKLGSIALIAIRLGHESVETTLIYLDANLTPKEEILEKTRPINSPPGAYRPGDRLLNFHKNL